MVPDDEIANSEIFLDCLSATVVAGLAPSTKKAPKKRAVKGRKNEINPVEQSTTHQVAAGENDAAELSDFVQVRNTMLDHFSCIDSKWNST